MRKDTITLLIMFVVGATGVYANEPVDPACDAMDAFFDAGHEVLDAIVSYPQVSVPVGSSIHKLLDRFEPIAVTAMTATWEADWESVDSWFPTMRAISEYRRLEISRDVAERTLALFLTPYPVRYNTVQRTLDAVAVDNLWIPGEYLARCSHLSIGGAP